MIFNDRDVLVCVFQRGAADGLNAVAPYGDTNYATHRPNIGLLPPGPGGAIDIDGFYGLHPAMAPLKPIYDAGDLAFVHACGIPHGSRSHFAAQGLVERGVDDRAGALDGWLGRYLRNTVASPAAPASSAFRALALSGNVPVTLQGANEPLAINDVNEFNFDSGILDAGYDQVLNSLFTSAVPLRATAQAALNALAEIQTAGLDTLEVENGAQYPQSPFGGKLQQAAQLIKSDLPCEVICIDSDNWDHHENLPAFIEQSLTDLANSLAAFYTDMGSRIQNVSVLVQTEFGRRVQENGSLGTDHGTAAVCYLLGGGVNGGQVIGQWPGLALQDLELGEDLRITTDLRAILLELINTRLSSATAEQVFPAYLGGSFSGAFLS